MGHLTSYKDLVFWQKSREVSLLVVLLTKKLTKEQPSLIIVNQMLRAAFSVGANIAEGFGRYKGKEYQRFLQVSLGSAREVEFWLGLLKDIYPKFTDEIDKILSLNSETIKMLVVTLKKLRS